MLELGLIKSFKSVNEVIGNCENIIVDVKVDNREVSQNSLFIAIVGERFNPLEHLEKIVDKGCKYVAFEKTEDALKKIEAFKDQINFFSVDSITDFIQEAGHEVSLSFQKRGGKVIGISGSNGKTTTKEMLYHLLNTIEDDKGNLEKVICTQKNNNNHLGVPFTLFLISEKTKYAIVELGSNHPGEIQVLCDIAKPQYGITTNIGATHLEFFDGLEGVFKEEGALAYSTSERFYLNTNDDYLKKTTQNEKMITFGDSNSTFPIELNESSSVIDNLELKNDDVTGDHNFWNLAIASKIALDLLGEEKREAIILAAKLFTPTANRSQWIKIEDKDVFLDAYNANPSSMIAALKGFKKHLGPIGAKPSEACVILGDMNELGSDAENFHKEVGLETSEMNFGATVFIGRYKDAYQRDIKTNQNIKSFESAEIFKPEFITLLKKYNYFFIKGSRSLQLETLKDIR